MLKSSCWLLSNQHVWHNLLKGQSHGSFRVTNRRQLAWNLERKKAQVTKLFTRRNETKRISPPAFGQHLVTFQADPVAFFDPRAGIICQQKFRAGGGTTAHQDDRVLLRLVRLAPGHHLFQKYGENAVLAKIMLETRFGS